jgi:hypothetical protein
MRPFEAEVIDVSGSGRIMATEDLTPCTTASAVVHFSDFMRELGVNPLPVEGVIATAEKKWGVSFCREEKELLLAEAGDIFILPLFCYDGALSALSAYINIADPPPLAGLCELLGMCKKHSTAFWERRLSDLTIVVPAVDFMSLIALFAKVASRLTLLHFVHYRPSGKPLYLPELCRRFGSLAMNVPWRRAVVYEEAINFVRYVEAEGGLAGLVRGLVAELAVVGKKPADLFRCSAPYKVVTVDELLEKPTLQM